MSTDSSKITQSALLRVATTRQGSTENTDPSRPNEAYLSPSHRTPTISDWGSAFSTHPRSVSFSAPFRYDVTLRGVLDFFHTENFLNASEEEVMFFFGLHFEICAQAKLLAMEIEGKSDRAYRAVLSALYRESAIISPPAPPPSTGNLSAPAPSPGNDAIEVVPAKGDLPPILLTGHQPKSHHPLAET